MDKNIITAVVSVIMPAYNASKYIQESIDSVIAQTYSNWELIIVDDGSTDTTANIVLVNCKVDSRIKYFYQENGKQGKARNVGIANSKGYYLAFLDADDLWMPRKLEIQIKHIQDNKVDLVFSDSYLIENDNVYNVSKKMNINRAFFTGRKDLQLFLKGNQIPILTVLVKKEKIEVVDCFSENLSIQNAEDYHLWLKLLISNASFFSSNCILAKYRVHNNSVTAQDSEPETKVFSVFSDLAQKYPIYKKEIEIGLKSKFIIVYKSNLFTKSALEVLINKNIKYLSKSKFNYVYLVLNLVLPTKVTKRLLIYLLNV